MVINGYRFITMVNTKVINSILIPFKLFHSPKNADIWRNFYYATLLDSHFCTGDLL